MTSLEPRPRHSVGERMIEWVLFTSRWLLAPIYLGLTAGLVVLLCKFLQRTAEVLAHMVSRPPVRRL